MEEINIKITNEVGRIDKVVTDLSVMSRSQVQQLLRQQCIFVNGNIVKANYKVQSGDSIVINVPQEESFDIIPESIPLNIVYEDDDIVVINKESGMVVHPSVGHSSGTLVNALLYHIEQLSSGTGTIRPGIVHRIDKDTSGLLVVAKNNNAHQQLAKQLEGHHIEREYIAFVHGVIENEKGIIDAPLKRDKYDRLKWTVQEDGKHAVTHFTVLQRFEQYTLLSLKLETGRTHQIRAHMYFIGHDIVGDPIYSRYQDDKTYGQLLHARQLCFTHPTTKEAKVFVAPLPLFFNNILKTLGCEID